MFIIIGLRRKDIKMEDKRIKRQNIYKIIMLVILTATINNDDNV